MKLGSSKLDMLLTLLDSLGNEPVIIWIQYKEEFEQISSKIDCTRLEDYEIAERFKRGEIKYLVAHPLNAMTGLTLTNCKYAVYYSRSFSLEEYLQSQDRIHRISQERDVTIFNLIARDTVDELIDDRLEGKKLNLKEFFK